MCAKCDIRIEGPAASVPVRASNPLPPAPAMIPTRVRATECCRSPFVITCRGWAQRDVRPIQDTYASHALCDGLGGRAFRLRTRLRADQRVRGFGDGTRHANMSTR